MSLNRKLNRLYKEVMNALPPEVNRQLLLENRKLFETFCKEKAAKEGERVPAVTFRDRDLKSVSLSDLLKDRHVVLSFFRGTWCPYCNLELRALGEIYPEIREKGAELIAVTPELYEYTKEFVEDEGLDFPVLVDLGNVAAGKFGLVFDLPYTYREMYTMLGLHLNVLNGDNSWTLPVPATFVISSEGVIRAAYVNADYMIRMEPEDILAALDKID